MTSQPRVDPRPVRPPQMGLLASANNVVVGGDVEFPVAVNINEFVLNNAYGPGEPPPPEFPVTHDGMPDIAAARGPVDPIPDRQPADDYETPGIGVPVHWIRGFGYRPEVCNGGGIIDPNGTTIPAASPIENEIDVVPYIVEGSDKRSTFGAPSPETLEEFRMYARRQLLACESQQIAKELWLGTQSKASGWGNRYLADNTVTLVEGDRLLGTIDALAALERYISQGTCGQTGMIHCRADTATVWIAQHLVRRVGNLLLTELGTIVVADSGYDGSAPATGTVGLDPAHAGKVPGADSGWAYATTIVDVRRSAFITTEPILERVKFTDNTLTTYERRVAAATWGCLHGAVHVDHTALLSVTGS